MFIYFPQRWTESFGASASACQDISRGEERPGVDDGRWPGYGDDAVGKTMPFAPSPMTIVMLMLVNDD